MRNKYIWIEGEENFIMNLAMLSLAIIGVMLCIGMLLRAKIPFIGKMLIPASVIGGIIGFIFMNVIEPVTPLNLDCGTFGDLVDTMFVLSFISIGLTGSQKAKKEKEPDGTKQTGPVLGGVGMGIIWCLLYGLTPVLGGILIFIIGRAVGMSGWYGILIPFGFCQGPGQASTYGRLFENVYGFENAEMVALTFAVVGFIAAFGVGVPMARYGLRKKLCLYEGKINASVEKGYMGPSEKGESVGYETTHSGNIDTLAFHFAVMGITYIVTLIIAQLLNFIPVIGSSFAAMLFFCGMLAAYLVKAIMRKLKIDYLIDNSLQSKISGWLSDFLVTGAFMSIKINVIGEWIIPILIECVLITIVTYAVCMYFGSRLGSDHDFERVLGLYGTATGTTPSGLSLVRMVDPKLQSGAADELGIMNASMILTTPVMILVTLGGTKVISFWVMIGGMALSCILYLILLKVFRVWRKPSFSFAKGERYFEEISSEEEGGERAI